MNGKENEKGKGKGRERVSGRERKRKMGKGDRKGIGEGEKEGERKGKGRWKEENLRKVGRTDGCTDTQVILYYVQCYALHWTDKKLSTSATRSTTYRLLV